MKIKYRKTLKCLFLQEDNKLTNVGFEPSPFRLRLPRTRHFTYSTALPTDDDDDTDANF